MTVQLADLERAVLTMLLAGDDPVLEVLRQQLEHCTVLDRSMTGVGFFCDLAVPASVPRLQHRARFHLGDVTAHIEGLEHGADFVLFVEDGCLRMLEAATYDEPWPAGDLRFTLSYTSGSARDLAAIRSKWSC